MKIRTLSYEQFKREKPDILFVMRGWQKTYRTFSHQKYSSSHNTDLRYYWRESLNNMITFLEKAIPVEEDRHFETNDFAFFIAEEDGIQGFALGSGIRTYRGHANQFFGFSGTFFEIEEMMISATLMLSRCYHDEDKASHKMIGKELLKAVILHVNTLDKPYPILAQPHYNNQTAHQFFEKNLFQLGGGSMGHSFTLNVADFAFIDKTIHKKRLANNSPWVIEDYNGSPSIIRPDAV